MWWQSINVMRFGGTPDGSVLLELLGASADGAEGSQAEEVEEELPESFNGSSGVADDGSEDASDAAGLGEW